MKISITCDDKYEAQKLASLIFIKDGKETYITGILNVVKNELVISLKDKSAHSILLKDEESVESFADFIQSVMDKEHMLISTEIFENVVEIVKEWFYRPNAAYAATIPTTTIKEIPSALWSPFMKLFYNNYN